MAPKNQKLLLDNKIHFYLINRGRNELTNPLIPGYCLGLGLLFCKFADKEQWNKFYTLINKVNNWEEDNELLERASRLKETREWLLANEQYKGLLIQFPGLKNLTFHDQIQQLVASRHINSEERQCLLSTEIPDDPTMEQFISALDTLQNVHLGLSTHSDTSLISATDNEILQLISEDIPTIARSEFESYLVLPKTRLVDILQLLPADTPILMSTGRHVFALYHVSFSNEWIYYNSNDEERVPPFTTSLSLSEFILYDVYENETPGTHIPLGIIIFPQHKELTFDYTELEQLCAQFIDDKTAPNTILTEEHDDYPTDYLTPLILAVIANAQKNVEQLIALGADVNYRDGLGFSPLHYATGAIAKILVKHGANVNQPIQKRIHLKEPSESLYCSIENVTPLYMACNFGDLEKVIFLTENGANINTCSSTGMTPLIIALLRGHKEVVRYLLEHDARTDIRLIEPENQLLREPDNHDMKALEFFGAVYAPLYTNYTAAMCAIRNEDCTMLALLIQYRDLVHEKDEYGTTLLHRVVWTNNLPLAKQLLKGGANPNALSYPANSTSVLISPLYIACLQNNFKMAQLLIKYGASTRGNRPGEVSCLLTVIERGSFELLSLLADHDANLKQLYHGATLLDLAIRQKHYHLVDFLLAQGVEPRTESSLLSTLQLAIYQGHIPTISKILSWYTHHNIPYNEEIHVSNKNIALVLTLYLKLNLCESLQNLLSTCLMDFEPADCLPLMLFKSGDKSLFIKIVDAIKKQTDASPEDLMTLIQTEMAADSGLSQEGKDFLNVIIQFACDYKDTRWKIAQAASSISEKSA